MFVLSLEWVKPATQIVKEPKTKRAHEALSLREGVQSIRLGSGEEYKQDKNEKL